MLLSTIDFAGGTSKPRRLADVQKYFSGKGFTVHHGTIFDGDVLVGVIQPVGREFGLYPFEDADKKEKQRVSAAAKEYSMPVFNGYERKIEKDETQ